MSTFNHRIQVTNGSTTDTFHPETNTGQVYDFTNNKWLNATIGNLSILETEAKISLVDSLNEIAKKVASGGGGDGFVDLSAHEKSAAPHRYGNKFEWRYNPTTNSLDLVVLD